MTGPAFQSAEVARVFASFPDEARAPLLALRQLIFQCAEARAEIGALTETLKWGQPAYRPEAAKTGTTLRLGVPESGGFAIYAPCATRVISDFRQVAGQACAYDGNRAVVFAAGAAPEPALMRLLILGALGYHLPA